MADVGVTGVPHPTAGEVPRAYVVIKPGQSATEAELKTFVKGGFCVLSVGIIEN